MSGRNRGVMFSRQTGSANLNVYIGARDFLIHIRLCHANMKLTVVTFYLQALGKISSEGVFIEQLETDPSKYMPEVTDSQLGGEVVEVNEGKFYTQMYLYKLIF